MIACALNGRGVTDVETGDCTFFICCPGAEVDMPGCDPNACGPGDSCPEPDTCCPQGDSCCPIGPPEPPCPCEYQLNSLVKPK